MDDNSKVKILLFFDSLRRDMNSLDDMDFPRVGRRYAEDGYFSAVNKMNDLIQEFKCKEIDNDGSM